MTRRAKIWKIASATIGIIVVFSIVLTYYRYVTLKKELILRLSDKASTVAGQKVNIGDLSFGPSAGINFHDIAVKNPDGFPEGELLRVKRVSLQVNFPELFRGRISLKTVEVAVPELTLMRDGNGRLNISDTLRALLSKKGTTKYQIDVLKISSGKFDLNKDRRYHNSDITVTLRHLSSDPGTKTLIEASASPPGESQLSVKGWAYLNDDPRRVDLSASWKSIQFSLFEEFMGKRIAGDEKSQKVDISLHAEGDTKSGVALKSGLQMKKARFQFLKGDIKDIALNVDAFVNLSDDSLTINNAVLTAGDQSAVRLAGVVKDLRGTPSYSTKVQINVSDLSAIWIFEGLEFGGALTSDTISIEGRFDKALPALSGVLQLRNGSVKYGGIQTKSATTRIAFNGSADTVDSLHGSASVHARNISVVRAEGNKAVLKNAGLDADFVFRGRDLDLKTNLGAGKIAAALSGRVNGFIVEGRSAKIRAVLPETGLADIRSALWDVFPDKLLYAGLNGSVAADFSVGYSKRVISAEGQLRVKDVKMEGENGEFSIGPVNGTIPLVYSKDKTGEPPPALPSFERAEFQELSGYYARKQPAEGSSKITIDSFRYGFQLMDNIEVWVKQQGNYLNISRFDANIFGGRLIGSAAVDIAGGVGYRAGMLVKGISLTRLCEDITPIKGYITGKVDGLALIKGSGSDMNSLIGRADFWSYTAGGEKTKISREFLQKVGGPQMKAYVGERPFDKGTVSLYLQNGFLIFRELEISHKNLLGMTDLSVKVAPFNNRIALDHLMSTIAQAAERAKEK